MNTVMWMKLSTAHAANSKVDLLIFAGVTGATGSLENAASVFPFANDFESGDFSKWQVSAANQAWLGVVHRGFDGGLSMLSRPIGNVADGQQLFAGSSLPTDVEVDC